ncbi:DUF6035 family protein [Flavobacterium sp. NRK F10]|uniref:DUF6035 family protein n=1 Tax=Flavobacterium sp. NRK F10 TaxID=2954931 RepID=UPI0020902D32|nr:DUF6035 family protein [Flavobacterium sp. NRK F10]MCO6174440.1 DUF6035 family protein [Flavobacterium sp. NRK F10]
MATERAIKFAIDKNTGEIIDADELYDDRLIGFETRKKYNRGEIKPICLECNNKLSVPLSVYDRVYFKHYPTDDICILKDENLSPKEKKDFFDCLKSKESDRHKYLKNRIGASISEIEGISDVSIDDKFIFEGKNKRKPDVYCKYYDKEIVFEIQLSSLSQKYILSRYDFYKAKGIYLIWILDNFDVLGQSQTEKDIKYLSNHQNFFKLNEEEEKFNLTCKYKSTYLSNENIFMDKWNEVYIPIDKLKFDSDNYEVYFYNFGHEKTVILELQKKNQEKIKAEKLLKEKLQKEKQKIEEEINTKKRLESKINNVLNEIKRLKDNKIAVYKSVTDELMNFEENELLEFNLKFNLDKNDKLLNWISNASYNDFFIKFILETNYLEYNINLIADKEEKNILDYIFNSKNLNFVYFFKLALKRGYKFTKQDEKYILNSFPNEPHKADSLITISYLANNFENSIFIQYLFDFEKEICIIESAKQKRIIGYKYKPNEWINFANNAIEHYPEYWEYIELTFKKFGLFDDLIKLDHKKTFQKKLYSFYSKEIKTDYSIDYLFNALYPNIDRLTTF